MLIFLFNGGFMIYLIIITITLLLISYIFNRKKTIEGLKISLKRFLRILIPILTMLVFVSITLFFLPERMISRYLSNDSKYLSTIIAAFLGSISLMPGFIAFPLSGILKQNGVLYMVISAFTSTLMMVGVITFPVEKEYFGVKVALLRNIISFFIALIVAIITGIIFGEVF